MKWTESRFSPTWGMGENGTLVTSGKLGLY
jgi:hypothetical protein